LSLDFAANRPQSIIPSLSTTSAKDSELQTPIGERRSRSAPQSDGPARRPIAFKQIVKIRPWSGLIRQTTKEGTTLANHLRATAFDGPRPRRKSPSAGQTGGYPARRDGLRPAVGHGGATRIHLAGGVWTGGWRVDVAVRKLSIRLL